MNPPDPTATISGQLMILLPPHYHGDALEEINNHNRGLTDTRDLLEWDGDHTCIAISEPLDEDGKTLRSFATRHHLPLFLVPFDSGRPDTLVQPAYPPHDPERSRSIDGHDDPERRNKHRAADASAALAQPWTLGEESDYSDLITNLLHLAHSQGHDPFTILQTARRDFHQEAGRLEA